MTGAIIGDITGSVFEHRNIKTTEFDLINFGNKFTDDSVLTIAIADAILHDLDFTSTLKKWARKYPRAGYGKRFLEWAFSEETAAYNSWGNGSAMRVSPVAFAYDELEKVLQRAEESAAVTHNHPEGIKGAQAIAAAVFMARKGSSKAEIKNYISEAFQYNLDRKIEEIRPTYTFDVSCQGSVPEAIIAFMESTDYESSLRLAISLGGDSDTIACMAGGIAEAFYKEIPEKLLSHCRQTLTPEMLIIIDEFQEKYNLKQ